MKYSKDLEQVSRRLFPYYLLILLLATIPFGSNRPWAWTILSVISFSMLFLYFYNYARSNVRTPELSKTVKFTMVLSCLWLLYQLIQLIPLPYDLLNVISPDASLLKIGGIFDWGTQFAAINFSYKDGLQGFVKSALYVSMFFLTIFLIQSRDKMRTVLLTIVAIGVMQALWGFASAFLEQSVIRSVSNIHYSSQILGSFANRNHFAEYMNLAIAAIIGILFSVGLREKRSIHRESYFHQWQSRLTDWRIYLIFYFGLIFSALVYSESQGAWVSFSAMMLLLLLCANLVNSTVKNKVKSHKWKVIFSFLFIVIVTYKFVYINFMGIDASFNGRIDIWENSLQMIKNFWLTGIGNGSFQYVYPIFDKGQLLTRVEHAHNDYIELLVEQGVIGFLLISLVILLCVKNAFSQINRVHSFREAAFSIAALLGITAMLVHSLFDFNFQIPSNAIVFFVFLGIALLQGTRLLKPEKRDVSWDDEIFTKRS